MSSVVSHMIQAAVACAVVGAMVTSALLSCRTGRALLRRALGVVLSKPVDSAVLGCLLYGCVVWGGSKPEPPPVITEEGIRLVEVIQTPERISFAWASEDERIGPGTPYLVQEWEAGEWTTLASTTATNFVLERFTISRDRRYRVAVDITPELEVLP